MSEPLTTAERILLAAQVTILALGSALALGLVIALGLRELYRVPLFAVAVAVAAVMLFVVAFLRSARL